MRIIRPSVTQMHPKQNPFTCSNTMAWYESHDPWACYLVHLLSSLSLSIHVRTLARFNPQSHCPQAAFKTFLITTISLVPRRRSTNNLLCSASAWVPWVPLVSFLALWPCKSVGRVACAVPRGDPSGLVSLVADGRDGVAPAGLYS